MVMWNEFLDEIKVNPDKFLGWNSYHKMGECMMFCCKGITHKTDAVLITNIHPFDSKNKRPSRHTQVHYNDQAQERAFWVVNIWAAM